MLLANSLIIHENCQDEREKSERQKKKAKPAKNVIISRLKWKV